MAPGPIRPIRPKRSEGERGDPKPYSRDPLSIGGADNGDEESFPIPRDISQEQQQAWQDIADQINARFGGEKTWQDCARRWSHMRKTTINKMLAKINAKENGVATTTTPTTTTTTTTTGDSGGGGGGNRIVISTNVQNLNTVDKAVLKAMHIPVMNTASKENKRRQQNYDHSYSQSNARNGNSSSGGGGGGVTHAIRVVVPPGGSASSEENIKEEEEEDDDEELDVVIKEEEMEEMEDQIETIDNAILDLENDTTREQSEADERTVTTERRESFNKEVVPALVDCLRNVSKVAKLMCGALEDFRKLQKKYE